jgi:hypothetical protein
LPESLITGTVEDTTALFSIFFLRKEPWNIGCILVVAGHYSYQSNVDSTS